MKRFNLIFFSAAVLSLFDLNMPAADLPGVPRDSNFNNTGGYDATRIVARLNVNVDSGMSFSSLNAVRFTEGTSLAKIGAGAMNVVGEKQIF